MPFKEETEEKWLKIPTAEEFIKKYFNSKHTGLYSIRTATGLPIDEVKTFMTEFAKLHVKAALEAAADSAQTKTTSCYTNASGNEKGELYEDVEIIDENSILNAYPENLIV